MTDLELLQQQDDSRTGGQGGVPRRTWDRLAVFAAVTFAVSWTSWGLVLGSGGDPMGGPASLALWVLGGFGPPIGAVVAARLDGRRQVRDLLGRLLRWRIGIGWYALLALPLAVAVATVTILGWPAKADASLLGAVAVALPTFAVMAIAGGGLEELGWRGYAVPIMQARIGALPAAVAVGLVWAVWHLPLYAMVNTTQSESHFGWFTLQAVALSVILSWIFNGTAGSVLLPVLFHAAVSTFYGSVLGHVQVVDHGRFEMLAALLMSAAAITVVSVRPRLHADARTSAHPQSTPLAR